MSVLPQRDGPDVGGAQERAMSEVVGGYDAVRTVEWQNGDGSWTRLSTRGGWPIFETDDSASSASSANAASVRGFVAKVPGGRAVLFDPYTLDVLKTPYTPAVNSYEVQPFATTWNVPSGDVTYWHDVVLFDGTKIKVNGKSMSVLDIIPDHSFAAIPHLIYVHSVGDEYGGTELNTTEKRVFAVGRYSVTSWGGGGGVTETLTPAEPRTESRALTIGQRIDGDTAYLGELYHGTDGWDSASEWAFSTAEVAMLLTASYLVKTSVSANVAMMPPTLATTTPFAEDGWRDITYPLTPVMLMSSGTVMIPSTYPDSVAARVAWPWSGSVSKSLEGDVYVNRTGETKSGSQDDAVVAAGVPLTYHAENSKTWTYGYDQNYIKIQTISIAPDAVINEGGVLFGTVGSIYWYEGDTVPGGSHGTQNFNNEYHSYLTSSLLYKDWEEQSGVAYIDMGAERLVDVSFSRAQTDGDVLVVTPNTSRYDYLFANPYHILGVEFTFGLLGVQAVRFHDSVGDYKNPTRYGQDPSAITEINDKINARLNLLAGRMCYIQEDRDFIISNPWYNATVSSSPTDTSALTWTTKDFILYDPTNEVYITIEGSFAGTDNVATLTVMLKVQTRHHTTTQTLGTFNYTYTEMLVEREIGITGKYAVPSPQIRAIFAPLYQEQGSFKGAHYVTKAEEINGATAFHGFNFILNLRMYSDFDTCNDDNDGDWVYFVPCNLLEMLYAFVFSTEYGVAEDGTRYPVTYTARFNELRDTLFATPVRVTVKDGSTTNWTDTLGGDFAAVGTVTLHRT